MKSSTIKKLLQSTRCIDLLKGQAIIEIDAEDTIAKGCQVRMNLFIVDAKDNLVYI